MRKCVACDKDATKRISPDIDIDGIPVCDEHVKQVQIDLMLVQFDLMKLDWFDKKYNLK